MKLDRFLFTQIDNSPLIVFRIFFGLLITLEAWGAIATGWVRKTLVAPEFTFNFIGFDFLQTFPGPGAQMYGYFALMGIFGVFVMLGYKYRWSMLAYGIMWAGVYFMQKSSYNNHYYLLMLLCGVMALLPAGRAVSLDAKRRPEIAKTHMSRWVVIVIVLQLWIVYTYASVAKFYPDWLDATVPELLMKGKKDYWFIGDISKRPLHSVVDPVRRCLIHVHVHACSSLCITFPLVPLAPICVFAIHSSNATGIVAVKSVSIGRRCSCLIHQGH